MRRRAPGKVPSSIRLDHGDVLVMDGRSMNIARRLGWRVLGLTLPTVGLHNTLRPVQLAGVVGCVLPTCAQGSVEPGSRWLGGGETNGPLLGDWSSFC